MTPLGRYVLETVVTLFLVAGLAVAVLYVVRRLGVGRPTGPIQLAGRLALDARKAIYLVRIGETVYVIGASEAGLAKLGEVARADLDVALGPLEPNVGPTHAFRDLLAGGRGPHDASRSAVTPAPPEPSPPRPGET